MLRILHASYRLMKSAFSFLLFLALSAVCVRADWTCHTELAVVTLPKKEAATLLPDLRDDAKIEAAFLKLEQFVQKGTAQMLAKLAAQGASGTMVKAEQVQQIPYETEWERPDTVGGGKVPAVVLRPLSFEKLDVGVLFSSEATAANDGRVIRLKLEHSHVRLLGWTEFEAARLPDNSKIAVKQPRVAVNSGTCEIVMASGSRTLLGVYAVPEKPDEVEIFLLRTWTTPNPK
jgi:hypothetical protein